MSARTILRAELRCIAWISAGAVIGLALLDQSMVFG